MTESELFDALRERGVDADDPDVRAAVRAVVANVREVKGRAGPHAARRCMEAMQEALFFWLQHPDVEDMSSFEREFDDGPD